MAVTWITALAALATGLFIPRLHPVFAASPSSRLLDLLVISVIIMGVHKVESFFTREFDHCPVYLGLRSGRFGGDPLALAFFTFCAVFLAMMVLVALAMRDAPWPLLVISIWCAQGLHELHHAAKSLSRRRYYPGTITGLLFTAFIAAAFVPAYLACLDVDGTAVHTVYLAAIPVLFCGFYLEDRAWFRRATGSPAATDSTSHEARIGGPDLHPRAREQRTGR
jgi:hypothetical protein